MLTDVSNGFEIFAKTENTVPAWISGDEVVTSIRNAPRIGELLRRSDLGGRSGLRSVAISVSRPRLGDELDSFGIFFSPSDAGRIHGCCLGATLETRLSPQRAKRKTSGRGSNLSR